AHEAWARFEHEYADLVLAYCRRIGLQVVDAEDVWQATLLRLLGAVERFEYDPARGRFRSFLFVVVRSAVVAMQRRRASPASAVLEDSSAAASEGTGSDAESEAWEAEWRHFHLRRAFQALEAEVDARARRIFGDLLAGLDIDEVAARHGTTRAAVHKVKQRVRDRLRERIAAQVRHEDGES
nr:sigma-70 family RNA polymerase sigma factor [Planctomycetota bacterium]